MIMTKNVYGTHLITKALTNLIIEYGVQVKKNIEYINN